MPALLPKAEPPTVSVTAESCCFCHPRGSYSFQSHSPCPGLVLNSSEGCFLILIDRPSKLMWSLNHFLFIIHLECLPCMAIRSLFLENIHSHAIASWKVFRGFLLPVTQIITSFLSLSGPPSSTPTCLCSPASAYFLMVLKAPACVTLPALLHPALCIQCGPPAISCTSTLGVVSMPRAPFKWDFLKEIITNLPPIQGSHLPWTLVLGTHVWHWRTLLCDTVGWPYSLY
jgi:hypothetical protein